MWNVCDSLTVLFGLLFYRTATLLQINVTQNKFCFYRPAALLQINVTQNKFCFYRSAALLQITVTQSLTLPILCISESCIEIKINLNFYLYACPKGFIKAFIKPFEEPQRSVKIKI